MSSDPGRAQENEFHHIPVLLNESVDGLNLKPGDTFIDCTLGNAGHTSEVLRRFGKNVRVIAIDADASAIERSKVNLGQSANDVTFVNDNFRNLGTILDKLGVKEVGGILVDL